MACLNSTDIVPHIYAFGRWKYGTPKKNRFGRVCASGPSGCFLCLRILVGVKHEHQKRTKKIFGRVCAAAVFQRLIRKTVRIDSDARMKEIAKNAKKATSQSANAAIAASAIDAISKITKMATPATANKVISKAVKKVRFEKEKVIVETKVMEMTANVAKKEISTPDLSADDMHMSVRREPLSLMTLDDEERERKEEEYEQVELPDDLLPNLSSEGESSLNVGPKRIKRNATLLLNEESATPPPIPPFKQWLSGEHSYSQERELAPLPKD
jgi:hypothetical protein